MRLRDLRKYLDENLEKLRVKTSEVNGTHLELNDYTTTMSILNEFEQFAFFQPEIQNIKNLGNLYYTRTNKVVIEKAIYQQFNVQLGMIKSKGQAIIQAIDLAITEQDEFSISVKLPNINNLKDLAEFLDELDKSLKQSIVNQYFNGKVEFKNFESGSNWLEIILGNIDSLYFVAGLVWSAAVIRKKIHEGNIVKENVRTLQIKNLALEDLEKGLEKNISALCEVEANQLLSEQKIDSPDPEYVQRVKLSIKILANLLYKGAEIHHSLTAPENVQNLFPDYTKINQIESKIKYLPDNGNGTAKSE